MAAGFRNEEEGEAEAWRQEGGQARRERCVQDVGNKFSIRAPAWRACSSGGQFRAHSKGTLFENLLSKMEAAATGVSEARS